MRLSHERFIRVHVALLCVLGLAASVLAGQEPTEPSALTLATAFEEGAVFDDRNGDGVIDFVNVRFVLADPPGAADVAAAANVAARLGFESMGVDLPLTGEGASADAPIVAIGPAGAVRAGLSPAALGLDDLAAGEGLVTVARAAGVPVIVVAGADDAGTLAAAELLAGRLPHVWDPEGAVLTDVAGAIQEFLDQGDDGADASEDGIDIDVGQVRVVAGDAAIDRLDAAVEFDSVAALRRAEAALNELVTARSAEASAAREVDADAETDEDDGPALSYPGARLLQIDLRAEGVAVTVDVPRADGPEPKPMGGRPGSGAKRNLDLSSIYANDGFLGDANSDLIPDRTDILLVPSGDGIMRTIDLAARIGVETTGLSVPLVVPADAIENAGSRPTLVLIGIEHPLIDELVDDEKFTLPDLAPGQGLIQLVRPAFGSKSALVVTGGDTAGLDRAIRQLAEQFPHVSARGKDRPTIDTVEDDARKMLSGRTPIGQAATALYKLEQLAADLADRDLASVGVAVYVDKPDARLVAQVRQTAEAVLSAPEIDVVVESLDVQAARPVSVDGEPIGGTVEIPSEVDEFWRRFRADVIPAVIWDEPVNIVARLSEPPMMRTRIEQQAVQELVDAGAMLSEVSVSVLSAYKQGYSWLYDAVRPRLARLPVARIEIRFAEIGPPPGWQQQAMFTPTRWLLELHPIDEILARELDLPLETIAFEKMPIGSPTYELIAWDAAGGELLRQTFEPAVVVRSYFDQFPDYEKVRVTTGWLDARVGDRQVVDARIVTDPERFWNHFQGTTLPAIYDYVMALNDGKPRAADAPHFGELTVEVTLSEPDYQIGIDQEQIAPMEALHEEIYFATLHFFDVLGRYARGQALNYPGRVIPIVQAKSDGTAGTVAIRFTGFNSPRPGVEVRYRDVDGGEGERRLDIPKVTLERPEALAAYVRDGLDGLERLDLRVKVDSELDERRELVRRTRAERVDEQIMSADQVAAIVGHAERLREAGLYQAALAYPDLGELQIAAGWEHAIEAETQLVATLVGGGRPDPLPDVRSLLNGAPARDPDAPLVQWETPIPPGEAYAILAVMAEYPQATTYRVGGSYLGKEVWAMDLMAPIEASHWSHAKATTFKPTVVYSARQHANEVSSTSHVLKLAELLLTDDAYATHLDKVNVVIHPITNADGAQLAYDLQLRTPDHMLHAGYLGALGVDVGSGQWETDPIYPESTIRADLWRTWLPDIFLNPHGYPSHEWVQLFSEYAGWVRNRVTQSRDWWGMRGWFMPGFSYLDDPRYPRHKDAAFEIRDRITEAINAAPDVRALNARAYARYQRYGFDHDDENFKLDFSDDVLIYSAIKGSRPSAGSRSYMARNPRVTIWSGTTEAPDETARGPWMELVATAGLQWDKAILDYLFEGDHEVERDGSEFFDGVRLTMTRPRPPKTDDAAGDDES
ncbi:MAG: M14 family metallopeptidase [Vicinamibacterales bacterium]|nr:M14 family metallopeptidase [Vicinamibacterales bacterium]MDP6607635.1 M14 family metallopeptidase [Vicinamibacterales bacterium]